MPEIDFRVKDFGHPLAILRLRRLFERSQWFDEGQMAGYQAERLRRVVGVAYGEVDYYRRLFDACGVRPRDIGRVEDLRKLPRLSRETVRKNLDSLVARNARRRGAQLCHTSGTTGNPVPFYLDRHSRVLEFVYYWRHWSWAGYHLGDRFAQLNAQYFAARDLRDSVAHFQPHLGRLLLSTLSLSEQKIPEYARALRRHRPKYLKGLASPLYYLALHFRERGIDDIALRAVFSTGEALLPSRRRVIESTFHCRALDSYGLLEQAAAICECPEGGYHVNAEYSIVQLEEGTGAPPGWAGRQVVGTTLYNLSMPLLRYEVGDLVEPLPAGTRCRCGRTLPLVKAIHGRIEDAVITPDGRCVTALFIVPDAFPHVAGAQFLQEDERTLVVHVVPREGFDASREREFLHHVRSLVGGTMRVSLRRVADGDLIRGPAGKVPLVISQVRRGRADQGEVPP